MAPYASIMPEYVLMSLNMLVHGKILLNVPEYMPDKTAGVIVIICRDIVIIALCHCKYCYYIIGSLGCSIRTSRCSATIYLFLTRDGT